MKLATFSAGTEQTHAGIVIDDTVADLSAIEDGPASIVALLNRPDWREQAQSLLHRAPRRPLDSIRLHAPVPNPPKYMAIGLNARDHRKDINARWLLREPKLIRIAAGYVLAHPKSKYPFFFAKATSSIAGPFDPIVLPKEASQVDWEGELAVVIGTRIHDVTPAVATAAIAGYTVADDITVRDWQCDNPTSAALAKSYPSHGPLGPWLVTADELDVNAVELRTYLNGEVRQRGRIADLILTPAEVISQLSKFCALEPGDVVACGTFAGTGWPAGRFLQPGDIVRVEIDGIGHIANPVVSSQHAATAGPDRELDRIG
ncbi:MAG: hydrolase family protein [Mycobacterium sp.]|nr:hydrolase family protein [Mycobacterium sp.]